jgi:hypothetical protein
MRVRMHDETIWFLEDEKCVVGAAICIVLLVVGIAIRSSTRQRNRDVVVRGMRVLDSIPGVVYDPEEMYETLLAFCVPISLSVDQGTVDLTGLNKAIIEIGGSLVGVANSAQPNKRNLAIRVNKTAPVSGTLHLISSCIIALSVLGFGIILWCTLDGKTSA